MVDVAGDRLDRGKYLQARGTVSNQRYPFSLQVDIVIPIRRMEKGAFEILDAFIVGELPIIEVANSVDENIYLFFVDLKSPVSSEFSRDAES